MLTAYLFALLTGFVLAGFVSSLWSLLIGRKVSFSLLFRSGGLLPVDVLVVTFSVPLLLMQMGIEQVARSGLGKFGIGAITGSIICSFFQGVVLLSVIYNL